MVSLGLLSGRFRSMSPTLPTLPRSTYLETGKVSRAPGDSPLHPMLRSLGSLLPSAVSAFLAVASCTPFF